MKQRGFTLIELLVVIAIIGLLSSLAIVSLNSARAKANDAQIKSDLAQIRTTAELATDGSGNYSGFSATNWSPLAPPSCSPDTGAYVLVKQTDANVSSYAAYARLCTDNAKYFCVDSSGNAVELDTGTNALPTAIATTVSCQ